MTRVAAAVLVAVLAAFPLTALAGPPVTWLAVLVLVVGGAGVVLLSVPVVTAGAVIALIAYALALVIAPPAFDPVPAIALGATLVALLALVHFGARVQGAAVGRAVAAAQVRQVLVIVALGVVAAAGLTAAAAFLGALVRAPSLPLVVAISALGAVLVVLGAVALATPRGETES